MFRHKLLGLLAFCPLSLFSQPSDAVHPDWQSEIPLVVYPDTSLVSLYQQTWRIAADRVRIGPPLLPASPYLDENCYEDQIWIWDSCFMVMFSRYAPGVYPGRQTLDNLYQPILDHRPTPLRIHLRDNPPLFAWIEHDNYVMTADTSHIHRVLEEKQYLQRHFRFFNEVAKGEIEPQVSPQPIFRDVVKDARGQLIGFTWTSGASGMDNSPRGREAGGNDKVMWIDAISQQALSALYISRLYALRGDNKAAAVWKKTYVRLKRIVNERYWDEQDGYYYDVAISDGRPCRVKTPASFWAMMAEIPSKKQAARMVDKLRRSDWFGGEHPWLSLARSDKDFNAATGDYWRGGVWLPMAYMGTKALEKYGYYTLADSLAELVVRQQLRTYQQVTPHTIWECYNPNADLPSTEHGRQARPEFCGWSALGPISLFIENILGFREIDALHHTVRWDLKPWRGTQGIRRLKFGDVMADIIYKAESHSVEVTTNHPFTLIVDGKRYRVESNKFNISI